MPSLLVAFLAASAPVAAPAPPPLSTARSVRELPAAAADGRRVQLHGLVLGLVEPYGRGIVLSDDTDSIYVIGPLAQVQPLHSGDIVTIEGHSDAGQFAPFVRADRLSKVGHGELPRPRVAASEDLFSRGLDAQWVEVRGIVRDVRAIKPEELPGAPAVPAGKERTKLTLAIGDRTLPVQLFRSLARGEYVDAEVEVRALCFGQFSAERQFLHPLLLVPTDIPLRILSPPAKDPFAQPAVAISSLFTFSRRGMSFHRVHISGTVLFQDRLGNLWVRSGDRPIYIQAEQAGRVELGEDVEIVGFPERGPFAPYLNDSAYRRTGHLRTVAPLPVQFGHGTAIPQGELVVTEGAVVNVKRADGRLILALESGGATFDATYEGDAVPDRDRRLALSATVRVTGVCVGLPQEYEPLSGTFIPRRHQLLVRSPGDLALVRAAPWWTSAHLAEVLAMSAGALAVVLGSVFMASRRHVARERRLRSLQAHEAHARLAERTQLARDVHDTVAQSLGAVSLQLELAKGEADRVSSEGHLELAHKLVRSALAEVRSFIRTLRTQTAQDIDLPTAMEAMLRNATEGGGLAPQFALHGRIRKLPGVVENHVMRIAQEALSNAVHHSNGRSLRLGLTYLRGGLEVAVSDDGRGFSIQNQAVPASHYGILGMRERAELIGAALSIESGRRAGTRVLLVVPYPAHPPGAPRHHDSKTERDENAHAVRSRS